MTNKEMQIYLDEEHTEIIATIRSLSSIMQGGKRFLEVFLGLVMLMCVCVDAEKIDKTYFRCGKDFCKRNIQHCNRDDADPQNWICETCSSYLLRCDDNTKVPPECLGFCAHIRLNKSKIIYDVAVNEYKSTIQDLSQRWKEANESDSKFIHTEQGTAEAILCANILAILTVLPAVIVLLILVIGVLVYRQCRTTQAPKQYNPCGRSDIENNATETASLASLRDHWDKDPDKRRSCDSGIKDSEKSEADDTAHYDEADPSSPFLDDNDNTNQRPDDKNTHEQSLKDRLTKTENAVEKLESKLIQINPTGEENSHNVSYQPSEAS